MQDVINDINSIEKLIVRPYSNTLKLSPNKQDEIYRSNGLNHTGKITQLRNAKSKYKSNNKGNVFNRLFKIKHELDKKDDFLSRYEKNNEISDITNLESKL